MYCTCPTETTEWSRTGSIKSALKFMSSDIEILWDSFADYEVGIVHCPNCQQYSAIEYFRSGLNLKIRLMPIDEKVWRYIKDESQLRLKIGHEGKVTFMPYLRELRDQNP